MALSDAYYHAAFHAMVLEACASDPTGAGLVAFIAAYSRRGSSERAVSARALRDIYERDGSAWDADQFVGWLEPSEGVPFDVARDLAEAAGG